MDTQTITHIRPRHQSLHLESELRVLRSSLVAPLFFAQHLHIPGFEHRLCVLIAECDRLLEELDAA